MIQFNMSWILTCTKKLEENVQHSFYTTRSFTSSAANSDAVHKLELCFSHSAVVWDKCGDSVSSLVSFKIRSSHLSFSSLKCIVSLSTGNRGRFSRVGQEALTSCFSSDGQSDSDARPNWEKDLYAVYLKAECRVRKKATSYFSYWREKEEVRNHKVRNCNSLSLSLANCISFFL